MLANEELCAHKMKPPLYVYSRARATVFYHKEISANFFLFGIANGFYPL
jgi:hypothetical protein